MNFWNEKNLKEALGNVKAYNFPENWSSNGLIFWHENFQPENIILARAMGEVRGVLPENIPDLLENCSAIMSTHPVEYFKYNKPILEISGNSGNAVINMARYIRKFFTGKVIAVTGSSGKSTTTRILADIFSSKFKINSNIISRANTTWGISWNMTCFDVNSAYWIIETSLGGGMSRNSAIIRPDYAIITCIAPVHLTGNMQLKDIAEEKSRIFHAMQEGKTAVLYSGMNYFNLIKNVAEYKNLKILTFGENENDDIRIIHDKENKFIIGGKEYLLNSEPLGKHIMLDMAAALAVAVEEEIPVEDAIDVLKNFESLDGRGAELEVDINNEKVITVIDESYNANPISMEAAITAFGEKYSDKNKVLILGDMAQCGLESEKYHRGLATVIDKIKPAKIMLCGNEIKVLYDDIKDRYETSYYNNVNELFNDFIKKTSDGDCVMIKASNSVNLHKIITKLKNG